MEVLKEFNSEIKFAPFSLRIAAATIDFFSFWFVGFILGILFGKHETTKDGFQFSLNGLPMLFLILFWFLLIPVNEGLTGQTIGKKLCKITVVRQNLTKITILISLLRHLFDIIDFCLFFIGLILIAVSKKKQRIGDLIARTYVTIKD